MLKPHGFVLDYIGLFDKLEKALAFDSDEINAIVKDIQLLKLLFGNKMAEHAPAYLSLIQHHFNDKDVDGLIEHFRDPERRKAFFKHYKELEMLYEIISPDAFLRPFLDDYTSLCAIYAVLRKAYARTVEVDRDFQRKTNALVKQHIGSLAIEQPSERVAIDSATIALIKAQKGGPARKVVNLVKSIDKAAEESSEDPFLLAMAERARQVQERFEQRQSSTLRSVGAAAGARGPERAAPAAAGRNRLRWPHLLRLSLPAGCPDQQRRGCERHDQGRLCGPSQLAEQRKGPA
jgi:type I restriction enzyme R subunit